MILLSNSSFTVAAFLNGVRPFVALLPSTAAQTHNTTQIMSLTLKRDPRIWLLELDACSNTFLHGTRTVGFGPVASTERS